MVGGAQTLRDAAGLLQQRCEETGILRGRTGDLRRPLLPLFLLRGPAFRPATIGKLCTAHIITLHGDTIYDTAKWPSSGGVCDAHDYNRLERRPRESSGRAALPSEVHLMSMAVQRNNLLRWGGCVAYGPPVGFGLPIEVPERPLVVAHPAAAMHHHASFGLVSDAGHPFIHVMVDRGDYSPTGWGINANEAGMANLAGESLTPPKATPCAEKQDWPRRTGRFTSLVKPTGR